MAKKQVKKNKQKDKKNIQDMLPFEPVMVISGLIMCVLSLVTLFKWGFLGVFMVNILRLFVGEAYGLVVLIELGIGLSLIWRGRLRAFNWKQLVGTVLIMIAVTAILQLQLASPINVWQTFTEELFNQTISTSLGGGLLGVLVGRSLRYLIGTIGAMISFVLVLIAGCAMFMQLTLEDCRHIMSSIGHRIVSFVVGVRPAMSQVREVFNQTDDDDYIDDDYEYDYVEEFEVPDNASLSKVVSDEDETPVFLRKGGERVVVESYQRDTDAVLDLDYFDRMSQEAQTISPVEETSVAPVNAVQQPDVEQEREATHWQSQANTANALTDDGMIEDVEIIEPQPVKRRKPSKKYQFPGKDLLKKIPPVDQSEEYARINENIKKLEQTFESFGVNASVVRANLGPSVTKYEIQPAIGVKVSKIVSLSDDIALALAARDIRMEAPIPGKSLIGIEVPNTQVSPVSFWEIIDAALESKNILEVPLGRDISGTVCLADLSKMPHLLIAGATGSGKSVGMNVIIVSLLMKAHPDDVKFLMVDPKKVELTMYDGLPHLLAPVVTNPRKAAQALNKVVQEMERRYELFAETGVRNIDGFNQYVKQNADTYEKMPQIVVFVDELADLMMVASNEVENAIIRLAQMARAAGIHMILATQRPSVDVITGLIKANVPSRLAFAVSSGTDSRTILDSVGAEKLLGRGDMLFQPMGKNKPVRVQGAYISDAEVERITQFIKEQQTADYSDSVFVIDDQADVVATSEDELFDEAVELIRGQDTISISQLQRKFRIGYNRAARLVDDMEAQGLVAPPEGSKPRQVLIQEE